MDDTAKKRWLAVDVKGSRDVEVVPMEDWLTHYIGKQWKEMCPCLPHVLEEQPGAYILVHHAWDGRE